MSVEETRNYPKWVIDETIEASESYPKDMYILSNDGIYKGEGGGIAPTLIAGSGGGSGGTTNYNDLSNQPTINGVVLTGNKTSDDLNIKVSTLISSFTPVNYTPVNNTLEGHLKGIDAKLAEIVAQLP